MSTIIWCWSSMVYFYLQAIGWCLSRATWTSSGLLLTVLVSLKEPFFLYCAFNSGAAGTGWTLAYLLPSLWHQAYKHYLSQANQNQLWHSLHSVNPFVPMFGVKTFTFYLHQDTLLPLTPHPAQRVRIITPYGSPTPGSGDCSCCWHASDCKMPAWKC